MITELIITINTKKEINELLPLLKQLPLQENIFKKLSIPKGIRKIQFLFSDETPYRHIGIFIPELDELYEVELRGIKVDDLQDIYKWIVKQVSKHIVVSEVV